MDIMQIRWVPGGAAGGAFAACKKRQVPLDKQSVKWLKI
jgi:hypothetical protein